MVIRDRFAIGLCSCLRMVWGLAVRKLQLSPVGENGAGVEGSQSQSVSERVTEPPSTQQVVPNTQSAEMSHLQTQQPAPLWYNTRLVGNVCGEKNRV